MNEIFQKYENFLKDLPSEIFEKPKVIVEYKSYLAICLKKEIKEKITYETYSKILGISTATIKRIMTKSGERYKEIWNLAEKYNFCDNPSFENFIKIKLDSLSKTTISKNKLYYYFYKKFNNGKIISRQPRGNYIIKEKINYEQKIRKNKLDKFNSIVNFLKTKRKLKKVNIIASTKSSEKIKKLAKDFDCKIYEFTGRFDNDEHLDYIR